MEYASKRICEIASSRGMNIPTHKDIYYHLNPNSIKEDSIDRWSWYQVINWIFDGVDNLTSPPEYLKYWYNTLTTELQDNEFVLEGFIGKLINWFEKNKYHIETAYQSEVKYSYIIQYSDNKCIDSYYDYGKIYNTKHQARHEGMLQCFKLIKESND